MLKAALQEEEMKKKNGMVRINKKSLQLLEQRKERLEWYRKSRKIFSESSEFSKLPKLTKPISK